MIDRLKWMLVRRYSLARTIRGFHAYPLSYATAESSFAEYSRLYNFSMVSKASLGRFTYVSNNAKVINAKVGGFCSIGPYAIIGGLGRHPANWITTHPVFYSTLMQSGITFSDKDYFEENIPVTIGNDVWIGACAIVLDGVNVGDGAIIGAGAVVTGDVDPYSIVGGIPAKLIRKRFDDDTIKRLMDIRWWDWPEEKLRSSASVFRSTDIAGLEACSKIQTAIDG